MSLQDALQAFWSDPVKGLTAFILTMLKGRQDKPRLSDFSTLKEGTNIEYFSIRGLRTGAFLGIVNDDLVRIMTNVEYKIVIETVELSRVVKVLDNRSNVVGHERYSDLRDQVMLIDAEIEAASEQNQVATATSLISDKKKLLMQIGVLAQKYVKSLPYNSKYRKESKV